MSDAVLASDLKESQQWLITAPQSVIISGGTQGLGMAVAECLIAAGVPTSTITGRDTDKGEAAATALGRNGVECLFVCL